MNKAALIQKISEKSDLTRKQAEAALNAFLDTVTEALKNDEKVQIVGFGTFELRHRPEHQGLNPATLEPITVKATRTPCFKPGKSYKEEF
ncbi:MAG: HU family DNA-binding protein [Clostridia bacterium]|nr:HU family DNA-binding protein [Clostridia bacterium]MBQ2433905.1 HU family DNA-binding protein [Clostridia bacterium]MBQ5770991.1 HU family DNA-binding protein [Clostridia bacterium]